MRFDNKNVILPEPLVQPVPPNDEIWYTSSDGNIVTPYRANSLPAIVSNTYADGKGIIKFASNLTNIGEFAFYIRSSLTSITIPDSVTSIGHSTFYGCLVLTSINIPDGVQIIDYNTFVYCSSLSSITIPNSVTSIGNSAFAHCTSLTSVSYTGTIAQFKAISKDRYWHNNVPATVVHCTDGDTPI